MWALWNIRHPTITIRHKSISLAILEEYDVAPQTLAFKRIST
jgi:hypothetical protein